jgi:hypothetical protein
MTTPTERHNFAAAVDPPVLAMFHLLPRLRRATDQCCYMLSVASDETDP